jgi:hypothetical protein
VVFWRIKIFWYVMCFWAGGSWCFEWSNYLQNTMNHSSSDKALYPRRPESSQIVSFTFYIQSGMWVRLQFWLCIILNVSSWTADDQWIQGSIKSTQCVEGILLAVLLLHG